MGVVSVLECCHGNKCSDAMVTSMSSNATATFELTDLCHKNLGYA